MGSGVRQLAKISREQVISAVKATNPLVSEKIIILIWYIVNVLPGIRDKTSPL